MTADDSGAPPSQAGAEPVTKGDRAYALVRQRVLSGELAPGQVVNQAVLARELGLSTTPLREGLRRLATEGLVELGAHRDARVTDLSAEEARDLLETRRSLDPLAVSLAAERRTRADIAAMREAAAELAPLRHGVDVAHLVAHRRFHAALYRASHNEVLVGLLDGLWDKADRYRRAGMTAEHGPEEQERKAHEHRLMLECVVAGDAESAARVMHTHIATSLGARAAATLAATGGAAPLG